jgi:hypothetical protein
MNLSGQKKTKYRATILFDVPKLEWDLFSVLSYLIVFFTRCPYSHVRLVLHSDDFFFQDNCVELTKKGTMYYSFEYTDEELSSSANKLALTIYLSKGELEDVYERLIQLIMINENFSITSCIEYLLTGSYPSLTCSSMIEYALLSTRTCHTPADLIKKLYDYTRRTQ